MIRRSLSVVLLASLTLLGGCAGSDEEEANLACPRVAFLRDAAQITQFATPDSTAASDLVSRARFLDFEGGCDYDDEGVTVDFDVRLGAERGPALKGEEASYRYFVAITDPNRNILARQEFDTTVEFEDEATRSGVQEQLLQTIPLPEGTDARDYEVLVGFVLTPEQVEYNRKAIADRKPTAERP